MRLKTDVRTLDVKSQRKIELICPGQAALKSMKMKLMNEASRQNPPTRGIADPTGRHLVPFLARGKVEDTHITKLGPHLQPALQDQS